MTPYRYCKKCGFRTRLSWKLRKHTESCRG